MKLPGHIEKDIRAYARERGWDEEQYRQFVLSWSHILKENIRIKKQKQSKIKEAA